MAVLGNNERSHVIDLINEITLFVNDKDLVIKKANGERTIFNSQEINGVTRNIMFPDILLYPNENQNDVLQGWEVKMPDVPVTNSDFINDAQYKADTLGLESTVLWNFNTVVLYVKNDNEWELLNQWNDMSELQTREDVGNNPQLWKDFLYDFLIELNEYILNGTINEHPLVEITENVTSTIVNENKERVASHLTSEAKNDRRIESTINLWWDEAKQEFLNDENNGFTAYSKIILLSWINRIIFAHIIKQYHNSALEIELIGYDENGNPTHTPEEVNQIFTHITSVSDFYTIFESKPYDSLIPDYTWKQLVNFNIFFLDKQTNQEMLQDLLEGTVNRAKRIVNGQFTTPIKLARLLVRSTTTNLMGQFIDPCTATGTISNQILDLVSERNPLRIAHENTWASDKQKFVLQFANLSMTDIQSVNLVNQIFHENVFNINVGKETSFRDPMDGAEINKEIPQFSTILSNLPFIQFESHEIDEEQIIENLIETVKAETDIKLSKRSDYYMYIILYIHRLLEEEGKVGVITSNSWFGTGAGKLFFKALSHYYSIDEIIVSGSGKWFENADVVTCILILTKKIIAEPISTNKTRFSLLNENINDLSYENIDRISDSILTESHSDYLTTTEYEFRQIDKYMDHSISLNTLFYNIEWFDNLSSSLILLTNLFNVIRGKRRGWNKMFYPSQENDIEEEYIVPMVKSSTEIYTYYHSPQSQAFSTHKTIEELEEDRETGALNWIRRFENGVNDSGISLVESLSKYATKGEEWYQMFTSGSVADFGTSVAPYKRIFWSKFDNQSFLDQRIIGITLKEEYEDQYDKELLLALLNSIVSITLIETAGFGRALGALDINKTNLSRTYILNPGLLNEEQVTNIKNKFQVLGDVIPDNTLESLDEPLRREFDLYVLACYGIQDHYNDIKNTFKEMITDRLPNLNIDDSSE